MKIRHLLALLLVSALCLAVLPMACSKKERAANKTPAVQRADRRAYDGAPPVIPHAEKGVACISCHNSEGLAVEGLGFAPPSPHANPEGPSAMGRCRQCHVHALSSELFRDNDFVGLAQDLRKGERLHPDAPPVIPHQTLLRENCLACHSGAAAREEIRCPHPERTRCTQCHVEQVTGAEFHR